LCAVPALRHEIVAPLVARRKPRVGRVTSSHIFFPCEASGDETFWAEANFMMNAR
jgi:hypothetical protein